MGNEINRRSFLKESAALPVLAAAGLGLVSNDSYGQRKVKRIGEPRLKTSICAYSMRKYFGEGKMNIDDFIEYAAKLGFDGAELTFYYFPNYPERCSDEYLYHVKKKAFLAGLEINGTAVGNDFCVSDKGKLAEEIKKVKTWTECASKLGTPEMRVFGGRVPEGDTEEASVNRAVEAFKECCEHASKYGVMLALENHGGICTSAEQVLNIIKRVDSEWMGANLDTGNFRSDEPYEEIAMVAPYALTCHVKVSVKGEEVDMNRVVKILREANYSGYLPIEYEEKEDPMTGVPKFLKKIRAALG